MHRDCADDQYDQYIVKVHRDVRLLLIPYAHNVRQTSPHYNLPGEEMRFASCLKYVCLLFFLLLRFFVYSAKAYLLRQSFESIRPKGCCRERLRHSYCTYSRNAYLLSALARAILSFIVSSKTETWRFCSCSSANFRFRSLCFAPYTPVAILPCFVGLRVAVCNHRTRNLRWRIGWPDGRCEHPFCAQPTYRGRSSG
jgi:hypothetical protein